jgi:nitrate/nitrite transport system permease protein
MVSAVFHGPIDGPATPPIASNSIAETHHSTTGFMQNLSKTTAAAPALAQTDERRGPTRDFWLLVLPPLLGLGLLVVLWALVAISTAGRIPSPLETWKQAVEVFSDPFYRNGPNDQGVGWNVLMSLQRVALGFGLAALVGIPAGFAIGRFTFLARMFNPIISLLRPVSPLAWLPIGLLMFKGANPAAIWTIFICSIWPMVINTAVGVQRVPQDYMNVARVLQLSEWKILTKILFPSVLPYMLTGVRLAVGTAWLVIVAAEMLTGGVGIGFWVWDEWNNLNVKNIIVAIFVIGIVGLVLEFALIKLASAFTFDEVKS